MTGQARARIGTSGYQYDHWREIFYPTSVPKKRWFEYYARHFDTVEINNTFYNLPELETFQHWREQTPERFCYALKFSRYGSHMKRLKDPENSVDHFLERAEALGPSLGPILLQLPPNWHADPERLDAFLDHAPARHRWAIEFRDADWLNNEVYAVLREHNAALVIHDLIEDHPRVTTADWAYLRFHGDAYAGSYSPQALSGAARRIRAQLDQGRDVFAYFNNDAEGYAVENALDLKRFVGG